MQTRRRGPQSTGAGFVFSAVAIPVSTIWGAGVRDRLPGFQTPKIGGVGALHGSGCGPCRRTSWAGLDLMIGERSAEAGPGEVSAQVELAAGMGPASLSNPRVFLEPPREVARPAPDGSPGHAIKGDVWES